MNTLYAVITLFINTQLFGAAMLGDSAQERFDNALKTQDSTLIIRAFADLPVGERAAGKDNYTKFANFIRYNKPTEAPLVLQITDLYQSAHHPIRLWVEHNDAGALDEQLVQSPDNIDFNSSYNSATIDAERAGLDDINDAAKSTLNTPDSHDIARMWTRFLPTRSKLTPSERLASLQAQRTTALNPKVFTPYVPAKTAHNSLQKKVIQKIATEYAYERMSLGDAVAQTIIGGNYTTTLLPLLAYEIFFAILKKENLKKPPLEGTFGAYTIVSYPQSLIEYLHLSINDYIDHGLTPEVTNNRLDLSRMYLTFLDGIEKINNLNTIRHLNIAENSILALPDSIGTLTHLQTFNFSFNHVSALPNSIGNLTRLTHINGWHNRLTTLPESIGNLTNLHELFLSDNELTALPESIGNLTNLRRCIANANQLTTLPASIQNLNLLRMLALVGNPINDQEKMVIKTRLDEATHNQCKIIF